MKEKELIDAVKKFDLSNAALVLASRANPNVVGHNGFTPLYEAALLGHAGMVRLLVTAGADPNTRTRYDNTPLHIAANLGYVDIVQTLLWARADFNAQNALGYTPLHQAANKENNMGVMVLLLRAQAELNTKHYWDSVMRSRAAAFIASNTQHQGNVGVLQAPLQHLGLAAQHSVAYPERPPRAETTWVDELDEERHKRVCTEDLRKIQERLL